MVQSAEARKGQAASSCGVGVPKTGICPSQSGSGMRNELVAEEIEIHPVGRTAPFGAAQQATVEAARLGQVMHGNGKMKGLQHGSLVAWNGSRAV